ncbi:uncharacterized protein LOC144165369 [Haemaphysalis longicornis]
MIQSSELPDAPTGRRGPVQPRRRRAPAQRRNGAPTALAELLDVRPESQMEQDIALQGHSGLLLSASNIKAVEDYLPQLKDLEAQLRRERASLVEWLSLHRERRSTPRAEREDLQRSHSGLTAATLRELTQQMEECEVLKRQKLQEFPTRAQDGWLTRYSTIAFQSARPSWKRNGTAKLPGISWRREAAPGTCPHRHCRLSGDTCSSHSASSRPRHATRGPIRTSVNGTLPAASCSRSRSPTTFTG